MAQPNPVVPVANKQNEVVSWPSAEARTSRVHEIESVNGPEHEDPIAKVREAVGSGVDAAEKSMHRVQSQVSVAGKSLVHRIRRFADERPLQFLGIVAGLGFLAGAGLRIWRSNRYE